SGTGAVLAICLAISTHVGWSLPGQAAEESWATLMEQGRSEYRHGDFGKAKADFERALEKIDAGEKKPGWEGQSYNDLGLTYERLGNPLKARESFEKSIDSKESDFGKDSEELVAPLKNLATLYLEEGNDDKATELLVRALKIVEKKNGENDPRCSQILNRLALIHRRQKLFDDAEKDLRRIVSILEKSFGPDHPSVAI